MPQHTTKHKLNNRINLSVTALLIIIFVIVGNFINYNIKRNMLENAEKQMHGHLDDLIDILNSYYLKQNQIDSLLTKNAAILFENIQFIEMEDSVQKEVDKQALMKEFRQNIKTEQRDFEGIKSIFKDKKYLETGYPAIIHKNGTALFHPSIKDGSDMTNHAVIRELLNSRKKSGKIRYRWPENEDGKWKYLYYQEYAPLNAYVIVTFYEGELFGEIQRVQIGLIIILVISVIVFNIVVLLIFRPTTRILNQMVDKIHDLARGKIIEKIQTKRKDEIGAIVTSINQLIDGLKKNIGFAKEIGYGNLETDFTPSSKEDILANALLEMRDNLKKARDEEKKRKQEDQHRNWITQGIAKFGEILRQGSDDIEEFSYIIISNIVDYLHANQGGIFIYNDEDKNENYLELIASYAYNRRKHLEKKVYPGEGLVGTCAQERKRIYMTELPDEYIKITSGLGGAKPNTLFLEPLKLEDKIFGVIELASLEEFKPHEIEFINRIGETIASTLANVKINQRTARLLSESKKKSEEMAAQEEEMRQNLEELQATQEAAARKEAEMEGLLDAIDHTTMRAEYKPDGTIIGANNKYLETTGYDWSELNGRNIRKFVPDEDLKGFNKKWQQVLNGEQFEGIGLRKTKSGKQLWVVMSLTAIEDNTGNVEKILFLANDITEQKQIEIKSQELAEKLKISQAETEKRRKELEEKNERLQQHEQVLKKAVEKSKASEKALKTKSDELEASEEELRQNLEQLQKTQDEIESNKEKLEKANKKMKSDELVLKKAIVRMREKETKYKKQIKEQEEKIKQLREELDS